MTRRILLCAIMVVAAFLPAACNMSAQGQGPMAWIDQPLDGMHFPLGKIILQAHASDANGVSAIKFYVGESLVQTVSAGGGRLGEAMIEWTPPRPGEYMIGASGVDNQGNNGSKAVAQISIGEVVSTITPTVLIEQGATITPTFTPTTSAITLTPSPTATSAPSGPSFTLDKNANCRKGPGKAYDANETLYQGQTVPIQGRNPDSSWLLVTQSGSRGCWVSASTGQISGDINTVQYANAPALPQPAANEPAAEQPAAENSGETGVIDSYLLADVNPPTISSVSINPASIVSDGCGQPATTTISAAVTDDVGVTYVAARLSNGAEVAMSAAGGNTYQGTLGPYSQGNLSVVVIASDGAGHSAQSSAVTLLVTCIQ